MIRNIFSAALVLCLITNLSFGQSTKSSNSFKIASWSDFKEDPLFIKAKKRGDSRDPMVEVEIHNMNYSTSYSYNTKDPITLYQKSNDPKKPYNVALSITIPSDIKSPLVMLLKRKTKLGYKVYDIHPASFPYGSYKVANITPQNIYVKLADKQTRINANTSKSLTVTEAQRGKAFQLQAAVKRKNKIKVMYSNMLMNRQSKRLFLFFYTSVDSRGRTRVKSKSLVDFRQAPQ